MKGGGYRAGQLLQIRGSDAAKDGFEPCAPESATCAIDLSYCACRANHRASRGNASGHVPFGFSDGRLCRSDMRR